MGRTSALPPPRLDLAAPDVARVTAAAELVRDPTRAGILALLRGGPRCACELAAALGQERASLDDHLARLCDAGLVRVSSRCVDPRWALYERDEAACESLMADLRAALEPGLELAPAPARVIRVEVLGAGCGRCRPLETALRMAITRSRVAVDVRFVVDPDAIRRRGVMSVPALLIEGRIVAAGRTPTVGEIAAWLTEA